MAETADVSYPLDTLKTRYQSRDYKRLYYNAGTNTINRKALFSGLYQGVGPVIFVTIPSCECLDIDEIKRSNLPELVYFSQHMKRFEVYSKK